LRRAVLAGGGGGVLYVDTLKNNRARTVPLVLDLVPIVNRWSGGKAPDSWLFNAPEGGQLRESNWKRSVRWSTPSGARSMNGHIVVPVSSSAGVPSRPLGLNYERLLIPGSDMQALVTYHAQPGSDSEERLRLLASITTTGPDTPVRPRPARPHTATPDH
jgi:hypothetical protein